MRNKEIRKCPKCKKEYKDYPAISRVDNETKICPICGETEAMVQYTAGYRKTGMRTDGLTEIEKKTRKSVVRTNLQMSKLIKKMKKERNDERSRMGMQHKKMKEENRNEEMPKM